MIRPSKRHRDRQQRYHLKSQPTGGLMLICGLCYGLAGMLLTRLPHLTWIGLWPLALLASWVQAWGLTRPTQVKPQGISPDQVGIVLLTIALAASLNHLGSGQIDKVSFLGLIGQVLGLSLLGLTLAISCSRLTLILSKRLKGGSSDYQTRALLTTVAGVGLITGGLAGLIFKVV